MPNQILWDAAPVSRSTVLTTELNSLANNGLTGVGTELNNASNLDQNIYFELAVTFGSAPSSGGYCNIWRAKSPDGTNYPIPTGTTEVLEFVGSIPLDNSTSAQRVPVGPFPCPGCKQKFLIENKSGVAFPASGSTLTAYTQNDEIQ